MALLDKFEAVADIAAGLGSAGHNATQVVIDEIISATEGVVGGRPTLLAGTNNYLGLTFDADCIDASADAVRQWGTGTTGSRFANGTYSGHTDLEQSLAKFYGRKHAMVFTTGYQANLGGISGLVGRGDHLILFP